MFYLQKEVSFIGRRQKRSISDANWRKHCFLGTIFCSGLLHVQCSSGYLGQKDSVCVNEFK